MGLKRITYLFLIALMLALPLNLILAYTMINWGWSDNIGWLSLSDTDHRVFLESDGKLTGFGWTDSVGWIKFDPAGPYPALPNHSAQVNSENNQISGWVRACRVAENPETCTGGGHALAGGWDGWISLRGSDYGVSLSGDYLSGWAWSDDFGWIDFVELPVRKSQIILKLRGRQMGISITPQGLIQIIR